MPYPSATTFPSATTYPGLVEGVDERAVLVSALAQFAAEGTIIGRPNRAASFTAVARVFAAGSGPGAPVPRTDLPTALRLDPRTTVLVLDGSDASLEIDG
jgi:hypothetical protein